MTEKRIETTGGCPIIEGLMMVRLMAEDEEHPAIDAAVQEIGRLRDNETILRRRLGTLHSAIRNLIDGDVL